MQKILIATTNKGKLGEIKEYLSDLAGLPADRQVEFVSLSDVGITQDVEENGTTYEENSQKKAIEYARISGLPAISDDGGLEIEALGGAPGIDSKFFGGKEGRDEDIVIKMMEVAKTIPDNKRGAKFVAVVSFALPTGEVWSERADVALEIAKKPLLKLLKGFPYRSFLIVPQIGKYYHESELTPTERKEYNHRYKALQQLKITIRDVLQLL
ncbi:MAG TPA: non-canonical purine NTP pyrophosphatase [Patescibacteria group bacterium]